MSFFKSIWGDYVFAALVLFVGLLATSGAAYSYKTTWNEKIYSDFHNAAQDRIEIIRAEIDNNGAILRSLASFFRSSTEVSHSEFRDFSLTLLKDAPFIRGTSWVPVVTASERAAYEQAAQAWKPGFQFLEKNSAGKLIPAQTRSEYLPLYFTEPEKDLTYLGFDYTSEPVRADAIRRSKVMNDVAASSKIALLSTGETAILFSMPVFKPQPDGKEVLKGYVITVVPLGDLIQAALQPLNKEGVNILMHDMSVEKWSDRLMYVRSTRLKKIPDAEIIADYGPGERMSESAIINVGGRQWNLTVQSARGYFEYKTPPMSYAILAFGIVLNCLLFFFLISRIHENQRIGRKVDERTYELQSAKSQIETILFSARDGVMGLDTSGKITFCNPMGAALLGYFKQEMMGASYEGMLNPLSESGEKPAESHIETVMETAEAVTIGNEVFHKRDGTSLPVEYTISPIFGPQGVEGAVITFRDITERRRLERQLEQMARYDQLTNLANRTMFVEQTRMAIARAKRTKKKVGIIYIDLNNFKPINDTLGHAAGDLMLQGFAERMRKSCREYDLPARLGGDEFTVLADNLDSSAGCISMVERLLENLKEPFMIEGKPYPMSGSIGIAIYPDNATTHDELLIHADAAMYQAKKNKSLPYVLYTKDL